VPAAVQLNVHVVPLQTDVPPVGVEHAAHVPPHDKDAPGQAQLPLVQLPPVGQVPQAAPATPVPQLFVVSPATVVQVLPLQHPAHVVEHWAWHTPPKQTCLAPHAACTVPSCTVVVGVHTGPALQLIVPFWHGLLFGLHGALGVQGTHAPPLHTPLVVPLVQDVPLPAPASVSAHVAPPSVWHAEMAPWWQGLLGGAHGAPTLHAAHAPALQNSPEPHCMPFVAFFENAHTALPELQLTE
jgi:hypothetical protein